MKKAYFRCSVQKLSAIMGFHRWPRMRKRRKRWQKKKKSLGVGMSCVVDLCNWQRVSMKTTWASRRLPCLQRAVCWLECGICISYILVCALPRNDSGPGMTSASDGSLQMRRSAWLKVECPWTDQMWLFHLWLRLCPWGSGVCCVLSTIPVLTLEWFNIQYSLLYSW